jgi:hypothetical protein
VWVSDTINQLFEGHFEGSFDVGSREYTLGERRSWRGNLRGGLRVRFCSSFEAVGGNFS